MTKEQHERIIKLDKELTQLKNCLDQTKRVIENEPRIKLYIGTSDRILTDKLPNSVLFELEEFFEKHIKDIEKEISEL